MTYAPLSKLFQAASEFAKEVTEDIKDISTDRPTVDISYPNGIPGVTDEPVSVNYKQSSSGWKGGISVNGSKPTDPLLIERIHTYISSDIPI